MKIIVPFVLATALILSGCGGGGGGGGNSSGPPSFVTNLSNATPNGQVWCVIGDSFSSDPSKFSAESWPVVLQQQTGITVYDAAVGGYTFADALNNPIINGKTPVQYCIGQNPSTVIVMLGINDTAPGSQFAPLGTIESNAAAVYSQLKQGLPNARIVFIQEQMYDLADYPNPNTMPNKGVVTWYTTENQTGSSAPNAPLSPWATDVVSNMIALNSYIKGMVPDTITLNYWEVQQQVGVGPDGLHPTTAGFALMEQMIYAQISKL